MWSLDIQDISSPMFLPPPVMLADLTTMSPVSLLGMRGQCYSVVTLVIIVRPAGARSRAPRSSPAPSARISPALLAGQSRERFWTRVWGENFIKLYHLSCPWPALFCRLVCFREFYGVINYRNTSAVPGYTLFIFIRHFTSMGLGSGDFASLFSCVSSMIRNASHSLLNLMGYLAVHFQSLYHKIKEQRN